MEMTVEQQQAIALANARLRMNEQPTDAPMSAGDVLTGAARNVWPSTKQFASDIVQPIIHPIDTATSIGKVGLGAVQKLTGGGEYEKYADAVGQHFAERYGGIENAKRAFAKDPVGVLADASILFTGGGAAAARLPGLAGKVGEITSSVGRVIDPVNVAAKTVKGAGEIGARVVGDIGTGTGNQVLKTAVQSGYEGGAAGQAFRDNMRGAAPIEDVVTEAKTAVGNMRADRGSSYVADMAHIGADPAVLDFTEIQRGLNRLNSIKQFKGQELAPQTAKVRKEINDTVEHWRSLDPAEYHTAIGFDALKQKIGNIKDSLPYGSPERAAADQAYNAIRQTIVNQAPDYARIMSEYEKASNQIKELERTLSLGKKAATDTALRKLQSVTRNNVNTNYGARANLAEALTQNGAPQLMEKLAGQSSNAWTPRGIGKLGTHAGITAALATVNPAVLASLPLQSPRLVGEVAHAGGRAAGSVAKALASVPGSSKLAESRRAAIVSALLASRADQYSRP